jgi:hypothetical protein
MHRAETVAPLDLRVELAGELPADVYDYARRKVTAAAAHAREPVLFARVRVTRHRDPAVRRPVVAQANVDVDGRLVRAQVAAATAREAVDLLQDRLRARLDRRAPHRKARRGRRATGEPHEWRHGAEPEHRKIIRHKAFTLARCTIDHAGTELDDLDYDFHLFTECGTGQDSVLYRAGPADYRLVQVDPDRHHLAPYTLPLTISDHPAPLLSTMDAVTRLNLAGRRFVFYLDADRARGGVLYRRYDGHYGLVTPAAACP